MTRAVSFVLLLCILACTRSSRPLPDGELSIIYGANREGELEPCGCQVHQLGGLNRVLTYLKRNPSDSRLFVDAGDSFFSLTDLEGARLEREKLKATYIARALKHAGLSVFCPGERDLAAGVDFLKELERESGAAFVAANLQDEKGKNIFPPYKIFERGKWKIGVIGVVGRDLVSDQRFKVTDPKEAMSENYSKMEKEGIDLVLVLSHQGLKADRAFKVKGPHIIIGAHSNDVVGEAAGDRGFIGQAQYQGQSIGEVRVDKRLKFENRFIEMGEDYEEENVISIRIKEYKEAVRKKSLKESENAIPVSSKHPYVANPIVCKQCHQKQYDFWADTKHASAVLVLFAKNQHFDPNCVGCHSLGFQKEGGFSDVTASLTLVKGKKPVVESFLKKLFALELEKGPLDSRKDPKRYAALHEKYKKQILSSKEFSHIYLGVQCENCHGNRDGHPGSITVKAVSETSCKECHRPPHAAPYRAEFFSRVACPLSKT